MFDEEAIYQANKKNIQYQRSIRMKDENLKKKQKKDVQSIFKKIAIKKTGGLIHTTLWQCI